VHQELEGPRSAYRSHRGATANCSAEIEGCPARIPLHAAFVNAHPNGDEAAVAELRDAGVTVIGSPEPLVGAL
jgi:hypothetical protein